MGTAAQPFQTPWQGILSRFKRSYCGQVDIFLRPKWIEDTKRAHFEVCEIRRPHRLSDFLLLPEILCFRSCFTYQRETCKQKNGQTGWT